MPPPTTNADLPNTWAIFPCHSPSDGRCSCGKEDCCSPAKHPRTSNGFKDATTDPQQIADWWRKWPGANRAIATGLSGLVVVDIDADKGGFDSLSEIEELHGPFPKTVAVRTGGGGRHLYFRSPKEVINSCNNWRAGVDIKAVGGYVISPPSRNLKGDYTWEPGCSPDEVAIADVPRWLLPLLPRKAEPSKRAHARSDKGNGPALQRFERHAAKATSASDGSCDGEVYSFPSGMLSDKEYELLEHHIAEFVKSGISYETLLRNNIRSVSTDVAAEKILNRAKVPNDTMPAWVVPYFDADNNVIYVRLKPDNPMSDDRKYESPPRHGARIYIPRDSYLLLADKSKPVFFVEGEKKALCLSQRGLCVIGLPGIGIYTKKGCKHALHVDLQRIDWSGRVVYLVPDSDVWHNEDIKHHPSRLRKLLARAKATVYVVHIPDGADDPNDDIGGKVGPDDLMMQEGGEEKFTQLLLAAAEKPDLERIDDVDPADLAAGYVGTHFDETIGLSKLIYTQHHGEFLLWGEGRYRVFKYEELEDDALAHLKTRYTHVKPTHRNNMLAHVRPTLRISSGVEPGTWLSEAPSPEFARGEECLATRSHVIHVPSMQMVPATHKYFCTNATDYDFDPNAPTPARWLDFLQGMWLNDQQCIDTLQEIFGYLLTQDTSQQKIFMLVGPRRSGKGTIARVLAALVGQSNVAAPTLASLATDFGLQPLVGKSVAITGDARFQPNVATTERLLSISGEDLLTVNRKYREPLTYKFLVRFLILSNELPNLKDASGTIASRILLLETAISHLGEEDTELTKKLLFELPGILLWAIEGLQRLRLRGRFIQPESSAESIDQLEELASPITGFVKSCCIVGPGHLARADDVWHKFMEWCYRQGRGNFIGSRQTFGRDLKAAVPTMKRVRRGSDKDREYVYEGIQLVYDADHEY